ncbi:MAG TPA: nitroreductase family protein [Candidatus Bathyarchaeia archaeon]|nr:nitroreductase family protein [Candidatus Bathyarchaeia archaeon]
MTDVLEIIQQRHSARVPFDPNHRVPQEALRQILEAARWAPTAHNMQNFQILLIDDKKILEKIGNIKSRVSATFIRENYLQLSFSEEELLQKRVGILCTNFPLDWRDPAKIEKAVRESMPRPLRERINGSPLLLIVIYDSRKRAPASEGDVLGFISLGCVMENMWLMAQSLGISVHVLSVFSGDDVEKEVKRILHVPEHMKIAFAARMGYPISKPARHLRVRRDIETFVHHNLFGNSGFGWEK